MGLQLTHTSFSIMLFATRISLALQDDALPADMLCVPQHL